MSTQNPSAVRRLVGSPRVRRRLAGIQLLVAIVGLMWVVEAINALDSYRLDGDGIHARSVSHLWGILTAPFIHENFAPHLLGNTIPLLFMGVIIALRGAARLGGVTVIVIVLGGLGTWLIGPAHNAAGQPISTIGASGLVFGYATYLLARGFFDRSPLELLTGAIVGIVWGGALLSSIVPHAGISWQGHVCGALAGVIAAWALRRQRGPGASHSGGAGHRRAPATGTRPGGGGSPSAGGAAARALAK